MCSVYFNFRYCLYQRVLNREERRSEKKIIHYTDIWQANKKKKQNKNRILGTQTNFTKKNTSHRFDYKSSSGREKKKRKQNTIVFFFLVAVERFNWHCNNLVKRIIYFNFIRLFVLYQFDSNLFVTTKHVLVFLWCNKKIVADKTIKRK